MEERKDCGRARKVCNELLKKKSQQILDLQGEVATWQKELCDLRKETKTKSARDEARLKELRDTSRIIEKLTKEVEKLSSERDDLKNDVEIKKQNGKELKLQVYNPYYESGVMCYYYKIVSSYTHAQKFCMCCNILNQIFSYYISFS